MSNSRRTLERWEPNVTLESRRLTEFDAAALSHVVEGGEFEHRRLPGGCSDNAVLNRGIYAPAVLIEGTFSRNAVTLGTMLCQQQPTIVNGVAVKMGSVRFYAENSEIGYRAWRDLLARFGGIVCNQPVTRRGGVHRRLQHYREMTGDSIKLVERDPAEMLDLQSMSKRNTPPSPQRSACERGFDLMMARGELPQAI